jgi:excisionase family DNA binding protein
VVTVNGKEQERLMELNLMSTQQAAKQWGITDRQVQSLCFHGKIDGATKLGRAWLIPKDAPKPIDGRTKIAKKQRKLREEVEI